MSTQNDPGSTAADVAIESGPFEPTWASLRQFECPDWFRGAKLVVDGAAPTFHVGYQMLENGGRSGDTGHFLSATLGVVMF